MEAKEEVNAKRSNRRKASGNVFRSSAKRNCRVQHHGHCYRTLKLINSDPPHVKRPEGPTVALYIAIARPVE
jgi:hypothetical protein